jgi:hypothetical protein
MTPVGEPVEDGYRFPFRLRGDLTTDFGFESPSLSFRQNTSLRLCTEKEIARSISMELQLYLTYSNTDNQFSTSLRDSSLLSNAAADFIGLAADTGADSSLVNWQDLFNLGETVLNSRLMPKLSLLLDRANLKYRGRYVDVTLGKQVVAWGSGYAWNPTDAINQRNPLNPTEPKKGVGAIVLDVPYHEWFLATLAMAPGKILEESTEGLRLKFMNRWFDMAYSLSLVGSSERYLTNSVLDSIDARPVTVVKPLLGFDFNTVLFWDINAWLEVSNGSMTDSLAIAQRVLGLQRVFFKKVRVLTEFYYNSEGLSYPYTDKTALARNLALVGLGDMAGVGRAYFMLGILWPVNERWELTSLYITNSNDGSFGWAPSFTWQPRQDFKLSVKNSFFGGNYKTTEFGSLKNSMVLNFMYLF